MTPEEIEAMLQANAALQTQNTALTGENAQLTKSLEAAQNELATAEEVIEQQSKKIDQLTKDGAVKGAKPTVKVGDDTYTILHGVKLDNVVYTPALIAENAEVAAQLVKANSSAMSLHVEEETE